MPTPATDDARTTSAAASGRRHYLCTDDIDEHAQAQPDWQLHYEQLSPGRFAGEVEHVLLPGLRMVRETSNCATRQRGAFGDLGDEHYGFGMVLGGGGDTLFNGQRLGADSIMIGRGDALDLCTPPGFGMVAIVVERALLASLWDELYGKPSLSSWLEQQIVVHTQPQRAQALRQRHLALLQTVRDNPGLLHDAAATGQLRDAILIDWMTAIPGKVEVGDLSSVQARRRVVQRACELMQAALPDPPPSLLVLCRRIGSSPRKLEYCFREVLGTSPARYLRAVRLNGVRRELKRQRGVPGACVQDIAARWGFWHLGHFGADYKRQFGEPPSATLGHRDSA